MRTSLAFAALLGGLLCTTFVAAEPAQAPNLPSASIPAEKSETQPQSPKASDDGGIGSQPATLNEILNAAKDCVDSVHQHGKVDYDKLKAAGWQYAGKKDRPIKAANGPSVTMTHLYLGKGNVVQIIQMTRVSAACQTIGWIPENAESENLLRSGITERFNAVAAVDYNGDEPFKATVEQLTPGTLEKTMINDTNRFVVKTSNKDGKSQILIQMTPKITD
jgi:hypothetical protein